MLKRNVEIAEFLQSGLFLEVRGNDSGLLTHFDQPRLGAGQFSLVLIGLLLEELSGPPWTIHLGVLC